MTADLPTVSPREASGGGALLLDVREVDEFTAGHAAGVLHIPLGQVEQRLGEIPTDRPIVCVCRSGGRSALATQLLLQNGYDATNMVGGMQAWFDAGLPLSTADGSVGRVA